MSKEDEVTYILTVVVMGCLLFAVMILSGVSANNTAEVVKEYTKLCVVNGYDFVEARQPLGSEAWCVKEVAVEDLIEGGLP